MKYQTSKRYLPNRNEMGHFKARPRYAKTTFILLFILFILGGISHSIINAPATTTDIDSQPVDNFECKFINGGFACDDPNEIVKALSEYSNICDLESVECEHERLETFEAIQTKYSRADSCHYPKDGKCLTAIGKDTVEGRTVACPRNLKLGTRILVEGKEYICEDRYAKRLDGKRGLPTIDVFAEAPNLHALPSYKKITVTILP